MTLETAKAIVLVLGGIAVLILVCVIAYMAYKDYQ